VVLTIGLAFCGWTRAQPAPPPDAPLLSVRHFVIRYLHPQEGVPPVEDLYHCPVRLHRVQGGFTAAPPNGAGFPYEFDDSDLRTKNFSLNGIRGAETALRQYINSRGIVAVLVYAADPATADTDHPLPLNYAALAGNKQSVDITFIIIVGTVTDVRAVTNGSHSLAFRLGPPPSPLEKRIVENSPMQPNHPIEKQALQDYLLFLNRQPGRRVESAIANARTDSQDGLELDYLINQPKPWTVYYQLSNTGTRDTSQWDDRFGFVDRELTNNDDVLSLDYDTASFENTYTLTTSYDFPIMDFKGVRANIYGSTGHFTASDVGQAGNFMHGLQQEVGGEVDVNVFQYHELFIDGVAGIKLDNYKVSNNPSGGPNTTGIGDFLFPYFGVRLNRQTDTATTTAGVTYEFNPMFSDSPNATNLASLGRLTADSRYQIIQGYATQSFYLEPLFAEWADRDTRSHPMPANELAFSARGQFTMGDKQLIPELEETVGGLYSVRGYAESVVAGDSAVIASAEYRLHLPRLLAIGSPNQVLGRSIPPPPLMGDSFQYQPSTVGVPADWDLILKAFIDGAVVHDNQRAEDGGVNNTLIGVGPGVELQIRDNINIQADYGIALKSANGTGNNDRQIVSSGSGQFHFVFTLLY
jgi:hemolysin activation/secretion protein